MKGNPGGARGRFGLVPLLPRAGAFSTHLGVQEAEMRRALVGCTQGRLMLEPLEARLLLDGTTAQ
ncbi:unnamed protein product [marine sediment metagenome]|uniref:Uncharacterized protein n=1 Tax=marine sediment metagenome TaxID=412755 RepID=X1HEW0_9ZZZZ